MDREGEEKIVQLEAPWEQRPLIQERPGHQGAGWPAGEGGNMGDGVGKSASPRLTAGHIPEQLACLLRFGFRTPARPIANDGHIV